MKTRVRSSPPGSGLAFRPSGFSVGSRRSSRGALIIVLAGPAGSGKSDALRALAAASQQVLDLEGIASHRGSAFGGIGLQRQPKHDEFARIVRARLTAADPRRVLWVEDEGPFIGSVGVPPELQRMIASAPVIELHAPFATRLDRLADIYRTADPALLLAALARSSRRLGPERVSKASELVRAGDVSAAISLVLPWYDAAYRHRTSAYARCVIGVVEIDSAAPAAVENAAAYAVRLVRDWTRRGRHR